VLSPPARSRRSATADTAQGRPAIARDWSAGVPRSQPERGQRPYALPMRGVPSAEGRRSRRRSWRETRKSTACEANDYTAVMQLRYGVVELLPYRSRR
jgi:hypothetical protein